MVTNNLPTLAPRDFTFFLRRQNWAAKRRQQDATEALCRRFGAQFMTGDQGITRPKDASRIILPAFVVFTGVRLPNLQSCAYADVEIMLFTGANNLSFA